MYVNINIRCVLLYIKVMLDVFNIFPSMLKWMYVNVDVISGVLMGYQKSCFSYNSILSVYSNEYPTTI